MVAAADDDSNNPWISRNIKRNVASLKERTYDTFAAPSDNHFDRDGIPSSLTPFLGWAKLSACGIRRSRKRRRIQNSNAGSNDNNNNDEPLLRVSGRAIFFIHDPYRVADESNKKDDSYEDDDKAWFQGRFFPSVGLLTDSRSSNNINNTRVSPTSVVSEQHLLSSSSMNSSSWGLLAVQNAIEDECLLDDCGGYRELDLTIIRNSPIASTFNYSAGRKLRCVIENVEWTGGDMMRLSSSHSTDENGVEFEPETLMEGDKAMQIASKYFPSLAKSLQIHNLMNKEGGTGTTTSSSPSCCDVMVIIGEMTIIAPTSFVRPQNVSMARVDSDEYGVSG